MRLPLRTVSAALTFAITLAGLASCTPEQALAPAVDIEHTSFAASLGVDLSKMTKTSSGMYYQDGPVGVGTTVVSGYHVTVHYTLYLTNGTVVQTSVGGAPFGFTVGANPLQVIAGFNEGMIGMKVGGTRKMVIPASLGYGAVDNGSIPANSVLVFSVQLISVP
ncbi:MAG TPA: FKBP-type peptidyl-prolyl cis-trans isomerase [Gemmatimonadaceae bacterium]|nr:FKBP-type peptidyl-prolyl cis-trans isomerase [Gemmatimonadaceae bacterium]